MAFRTLIPRMFHRRVALLLALTAAGFLILAGRIWRLGVVRGDELRADAEQALLTSAWTPTTRGRILDSKGRALAEDRPAFDLAADYILLDGEWARAEAERQARAEDRRRWADAGREGRTALTEAALPAVRARIEALWAEVSRLTGVSGAELEARRQRIVDDVERMAAVQWQRAKAQQDERLSKRAGKPIEVSIESVKRPIREQREPHVLVRDVPDAAAFALRRLAQQMPGLRVQDHASREYAFESMTVTLPRTGFPPPLRLESDAPIEVLVRGVATHLLGWMRSAVFAEDLARRPVRTAEGAIDPGAYQPGDAVGQTGVELGREDALRGLRGRSSLRLDTGAREETPPTPGRDLKLTIDIDLQARVQALMTPSAGLAIVQPWHQGSGAGQTILPIGTPLNGAAVVLSVETGEALAMVSTPSFTREDLRDDAERVFRDRVDQPWVNRCVQAPYPPGSIVKAILLAGAVTSGEHDLARAIECTGHLYPDRPDIFRCWRYKQFNSTHTEQIGHALSAEEGLCVSCNIFFYTVGRELGPEGIARWFRRFGVGSTSSLGLGERVEHPGLLGVGAKRGVDGAISKSDAIHMAIGQGPVAWTPLHAADAYATLARGGIRIIPRLTADAPVKREDLQLDPRAVAAAMEGLRRSANDPLGTGHHLVFEGEQVPTFNVPGLAVWGKTGTAEAPDIRVDPDGAGPAPIETVREGDHSWFVALVGPAGGKPLYSVAVLMEYAGSGGRVSGPILNEIIRALVELGYLTSSSSGGEAEAPAGDQAIGGAS